MRTFKASALLLATVLTAAPALAAQVGKPAPAFTVTTFDNQKTSSADLQGKVVVLNYWATWCAPCRNEMPVLDAYLRNHPDADLKIFAVTTEGSVPQDKLKPLAAALSFPLISKLSGRGYGAIRGAVPTSYVIDRSGIVRHAAAGAFTAASFDALVTPLLAVAPPQTAPAATATRSSQP